MRTPRRQRPARRQILPPPAGCDLEAVAARVSYVGSPEHKDAPSFADWPRPRADATICAPSFATRLEEINEWLQEAIRAGHTGAWTGDFPRYVWHRIGGTVFEARLVNEGNGEYKAYELDRSEWPAGL